MGRDALVVDIPVLNPGGQTRSIECLRLCTTHLESLWPGKAYRPGQLALISALLKGTLAMDSKIIAGVVGGDMSAIDGTEHDFHKAGDVDMKDVWEDVPAPSVPARKPFRKDLADGRARGNTWGYQSKAKRNGKRMDKFFYTGLLRPVVLGEAQDVTGRFGPIGMGLKTEVEAWEWQTKKSLLRARNSRRSRELSIFPAVLWRGCKIVRCWRTWLARKLACGSAIISELLLVLRYYEVARGFDCTFGLVRPSES